jgi:hypothetical protein
MNAPTCTELNEVPGTRIDVLLGLLMSCRADTLRALDVAAAKAFPRVGWTLMCHGGRAVPEWMSQGKPPPTPRAEAFPGGLIWFKPEMLVCNAVQCADAPWWVVANFSWPAVRLLALHKSLKWVVPKPAASRPPTASHMPFEGQGSNVSPASAASHSTSNIVSVAVGCLQDAC